MFEFAGFLLSEAVEFAGIEGVDDVVELELDGVDGVLDDVAD